jgi:hypothetical protein
MILATNPFNLPIPILSEPRREGLVFDNVVSMEAQCLLHAWNK